MTSGGNYEAREANAIGAEYIRADLLPAADASKVRSLLRGYLDQRILTYNSRTEEQFRQNNAQTARLQSELWSTVNQPSAVLPAPIRVFILGGMNDVVLSAQEYALAAWQNRSPIAAWILLMAISVFCNLLVGYGVRGHCAAVLSENVSDRAKTYFSKPRSTGLSVNWLPRWNGQAFLPRSSGCGMPRR
jgi:hypothetical protein